MDTAQHDDITVSDAIGLLFAKTWVDAQHHPLGTLHDEQAWQCFLKTHYLMDYAVAARERGLSKAAVLDDVQRLRSRVAMDGDLASEVVAGVIADGKEEGILPPVSLRPTPDETDAILTDLILQASRMERLALFHGYSFSEDLIKLRILQIGKILNSAPPAIRKEHLFRYRSLMIDARRIIRIAHGEEEPIDDGGLVANSDDIMTNRKVVGSRAWDWWVNVLLFMAGQRRGQEDYDLWREAELEAFRMIAFQRGIEYDPANVIKNPRPPMVVPGRDLTSVAQNWIDHTNGKKTAYEPPDDWYAKFRRLEWLEEPSDEIIDGFLAERR